MLLRLIDSNRLVKYRRTAHAERINNNRNIVTMYPGDLFMAHTPVRK